jgi:hypothetical protein
MKNQKFLNFENDKFNKKEPLRKRIKDKFEDIVFRYTKEVSLGVIEMLNNTVFHFLDTLKVRLQAKNLKEDIALFTRNRVDKRRSIFLYSFDFWCYIRCDGFFPIRVYVCVCK